jgi:hypothetical protein
MSGWFLSALETVTREMPSDWAMSFIFTAIGENIHNYFGKLN